MVVALLIAGALVALGVGSGWQQVREMKKLRDRKLVPSDEYAYLRGRHRRRLLVGVLLVVIGGLFAGAYLSGMTARIDELGQKKPTDADGEKRQLTDEEKDLMRTYYGIWAGVALLTFFVIGLAVVDALASRRYWLKIYREMREEHNSQMRRDLAVYKQQKEQGRAGGENFGGRLGGSQE
jgi:hypothetical protein